MALSASKSLTHGKRAGAPMPRIDALAELQDGWFEFQFRASELTMIAGQPGSQKSGFALWLCSQFNKPTLYFSADSSSFTASTRLAAAYTGDQIKAVAHALSGGGAGYYEDVLDESPVRFCYDPNPTHDVIYAELNAWVEAWDSYPDVIVVDNLMDVAGGGDSEFAAYKDVLMGLKKLARETEAMVLVLHHMSETGTDSSKPAPRKSVMGKANQTPENVLSIALDGNDFLVSVVKHRSGPGDATAGRFVTLAAHPDRNQFEKWSQPAVPAMVYNGDEWWK